MDPKVIINDGGVSEEDLEKIEEVLKTQLPEGWTSKRNQLPLLGFLWDWKKDGWEIFNPGHRMIAKLYLDGRNLLVWGRANIKTLKPLADELSKKLKTQINVNLA